MIISDKSVPINLLSVLETGWQDRVDIELWQKLFPDPVRKPWLYSVEGIKGETEAFLDDYGQQVLNNNFLIGDDFREYFIDDVFWFGRKAEGVNPGYVDARDMLIIGEIGLEMMLGLNYVKGKKNPSVVYFTSDLLWVEVSPSVGHFLQSVGIIVASGDLN